ncbi:pentatricopeptide (PPR) repeat protein [Medicago truncatula]|uniref:Pentatricopeptide (PPR) repeat protein n=1 Tax=Medicago truncatula TaxID=3880 RepID=G7K742_MEDTR|nr:pentatricopeptide (PPR) repeat protein [Medicago truncatula]
MASNNAFRLLRKMEWQVVPNIVIYNMIIDSSFKDGLLIQARRLNSKIVVSLMKCIARVKRIDEAINLLSEMYSKNWVPDSVTYNSLIDGLSKSRIISYNMCSCCESQLKLTQMK